MPPVQSRPVDFVQISRTLCLHWRRWVVPAAVATVLAAAYCVVRTPEWEASQALVIRNEAANNQEGPGRFRALEEMKVTQETVLEIAKSRGVLEAALVEVGPPSRQRGSGWPSAVDINDLRERIALSPPKGTEFGKTEIFYLKVRDADRRRAERLVAAVAQQMQRGLKELRHAKAQSMIDELARSAQLAQEDLQKSINRLADLERKVGSDLGDLRMLDVSATGDSDLRRKLISIEEEIRQTRTARQSSLELKSLLESFQNGPDDVLATPNRLLESQPSLKRLKDGLLDAQLRISQLAGTMKPNHPQMVAAHVSEAEARRLLHEELSAARQGIDVELRLADQRLAMLEAERNSTLERLDRLAGMRAQYSGLAAEMRHRTSLLERAQADLAEARAAQAGAVTASLITLVDRPEAGQQPVGPSSATILFAGLVGGLLCGLGLLFLTVPMGEDAGSILPIPQPAPSAASAGRGLSLSEALARVAAL